MFHSSQVHARIQHLSHGRGSIRSESGGRGRQDEPYVPGCSIAEVFGPKRGDGAAAPLTRDRVREVVLLDVQIDGLHAIRVEGTAACVCQLPGVRANRCQFIIEGAAEDSAI
jgi:hypothetical protein